MKAEIIAVGSELLLGQILNTNAQFLSIQLAELGIDVHFQQVVGDNEKRLYDALTLSLTRAELVITTGGLGPTSDDITKETIAKTLKLELEPHQPSIEAINGFFMKLGKEPVENNYKQALFPTSNTIVLKNTCGTAPGAIFETNNKYIVMLPGPPKECQAMFRLEVIPFLMQHTSQIIKSKIIKTYGVGESQVEAMLEDILLNQTNPTIAPLVKPEGVTLRLTSKLNRDDAADFDSVLLPTQQKIESILGNYIYGTDDETLASVVVEQLIERKLTLSLAESCTGGLIGKLITDISGSSRVLLAGIIAYSNECKENILGVSRDTLNAYGAVSEETALEMATGVADKINTDCAISVTGIAGPGGGTATKPVGLVYIGIKYNTFKQVYCFNFIGSREEVRYRTALTALNLLRLQLL